MLYPKRYWKSFAKTITLTVIQIKIVNYRDNTGQTILHIVVDAMNVSALGALVELGLAGSFINTVDKFNMTPMHIAAINFDYEIFGILKTLNADMSIKDSEGKTPIDYLKENDDINEDIINEIINQH